MSEENVYISDDSKDGESGEWVRPSCWTIDYCENDIDDGNYEHAWLVTNGLRFFRGLTRNEAKILKHRLDNNV